MSDSTQYTAEMAADPELSRADMQEIAASRPDLLPALASNASLYPALKEWLAGHPDPAVQEAVAARDSEMTEGMGIQAVSEMLLPPSGIVAPVVSAALKPTDAVLERPDESDKDPKKSTKRARLIAIPAVLVTVAAVVFGIYWFRPQSDPKPELVVPEDAKDIGEFASPHGNVECMFNKNAADQKSVKCTVKNYEFVPQATCDKYKDPVTFELYEDGTMTELCTSINIVDDKPRLHYGMSAARDGFACKLEESVGFTCWDVDSGQGFTIGTYFNEMF